MRIWKRNWIVLTAVIVHGIWAILLLFSAEPLSCTPMAMSPLRHNQYLASAIYGFACIAALCPLIYPKWDRGIMVLICCAPQQFLLMVSAGTATICVLRESYADNVRRPWEFILADQLWVIVGMTLHTLSLIDWYYFSWKEPTKPIK